jgi:predicted PurR-regulated permease PerM
MTVPEKADKKTSWLLILTSIVVVVTALYLAKGLLIPVTLAVLLSFLLSPVCNWLERWKLGRIPAVLVTAVLGFTLLGMVIWAAFDQMSRLAPKIPEYSENVKAKLNSVNQYAVAALAKLTRNAQKMEEGVSPTKGGREPQGTEESPFAVRVLSSPSSPLSFISGIFGTLIEGLGTAGIVIVLVVFFLIQREDLRDRFMHLVGKGRLTLTTQMMEDAAARVSRYLSMLLFLNVTFGISVGIGLYFIDVPNAVLCGIVAMAFRFVPYIGPWIAAILPIGLSLAISPGWGPTIWTIGLFVALELFNNNLLEPWLYGKHTGVSAVAVMLAAVFWMWLWGPVGLLLATPLTVCVLVVGKHVPQLSFLDILLGTDEVFQPPERIYQRLVAGDQEQAAELLEGYLEKQPLVEVYDAVLIPALALAETHWQLGELTERKHDFILQSIKELIHEQGERQQETQAKEAVKTAADDTAPAPIGTATIGTAESEEPPLRVLCLPARTEADEITALMLAQVLSIRGCVARVIPIASMADKLADLDDQGIPDAICVCATPPAAVMHARYLCKRLGDRLAKVKLVVGLWNSQSDLEKAKERIGCEAAVVTTLAAAQGHAHLTRHLPAPPRQPLQV